MKDMKKIKQLPELDHAHMQTDTNFITFEENGETYSQKIKYVMPPSAQAYYKRFPLAQEFLKDNIRGLMHMEEHFDGIYDMEDLLHVVWNHTELVKVFAKLNDYSHDEHIGTGRVLELANEAYMELLLEQKEQEAAGKLQKNQQEHNARNRAQQIKNLRGAHAND